MPYNFLKRVTTISFCPQLKHTKIKHMYNQLTGSHTNKQLK